MYTVGSSAFFGGRRVGFDRSDAAPTQNRALARKADAFDRCRSEADLSYSEVGTERFRDCCYIGSKVKADNPDPNDGSEMRGRRTRKPDVISLTGVNAGLRCV